MHARLHQARSGRLAIALGTAFGAVLTACGTGVFTASSSLAVLVAAQHRSIPAERDLIALRRSGVVELIDADSHRVAAVLATGADPAGGVSISPSLEFAFVTARGRDGLPAVWALPLGSSEGRAIEAVPDAELPAVSPDGGYLGYVMLDGSGTQEGVAITVLDAGGLPVGRPQRFRASSVPPPFPITGIAVGRRDAQLAVWGGFVDKYLGAHQPTVGTLTPSTSTSLRQLTGVCDPVLGGLVGGPLPIQEGATTTTEGPHFVGCSAPIYEPDGYLMYGDQVGAVDMPFGQDSGGIDGGGVRIVYPGVGRDTVPLQSLAFGPGSSIAFVTSQGDLDVVPAGAYLPYGPGAENMPPPTPSAVPVGSGFTAVAWTPGPSAAKTPLPRLYSVVPHLPDLIGMTERRADSILAVLFLPVTVTIVTSDKPTGIVTGQNPPPGDGEACQCGVTLNVSAGPG